MGLALTEAVTPIMEMEEYLNTSNNFLINMDLENGGEYYSLSLEMWKLEETAQKTDFRGRIHLGRQYIGREIRVFVADNDYKLLKCENYTMLPKKYFTEVRMKIGEHTGEPMAVKSNGDIWTNHKDKFIKVFLKVIV